MRKGGGGYILTSCIESTKEKPVLAATSMVVPYLKLTIILVIYFSFILQLLGILKVRCMLEEIPEDQILENDGEDWDVIPECIPPLPLAHCNNDRCGMECANADAATDRDQCSDEATCCCNSRCRVKLAYVDENGNGFCTHAACGADCGDPHIGGQNSSVGGHCDNPKTCCCDPREDDIPGEEVPEARHSMPYVDLVY